MNIRELQQEVHQTACNKGWWDTERPVAEVIALMHSELSEALEEWRAGHHPVDVYLSAGGKPEGFGVELADCIIRILDTAEHYGINMEQLIAQKIAYNQTRPHRHGGKLA